jgi:hypothetical protein
MNTRRTSLIFLFAVLIQIVSNVTIQAQLATFENFSEEEFIAKLNEKKSTKLESGAIVISSYEYGLAKTKLNNKYGLVNKDGDEIRNPIYDEIYLFKNGYAHLKKEGIWIMVNKDGVLLTEY